jgi:nitrogen fixation protein NifU and related proteins
MDLYRDIILDHFKHPHNFGKLDNPEAIGEAYNATCGDKIRMEIIFNQKTEVVSEVKFSGDGCAISQAAASMLTEKVLGMTKKEILAITSSEIMQMLGTQLTPSRVKCATLPLEVIQKALVQ